MKIVNTLQDKLKEKLLGYVFWLLIVILSVSLFGSINRSKIVNEEIESKKLTLKKIEEDNKKLEQKVLEVQSQEYIEKEIRNKLGLVKNGEVIVVLPDQATLEKLAPQVNNENEVIPDPNWKRWLKLFM